MSGQGRNSSFKGPLTLKPPPPTPHTPHPFSFCLTLSQTVLSTWFTRSLQLILSDCWVVRFSCFEIRFFSTSSKMSIKLNVLMTPVADGRLSTRPMVVNMISQEPSGGNVLKCGPNYHLVLTHDLISVGWSKVKGHCHSDLTKPFFGLLILFYFF